MFSRHISVPIWISVWADRGVWLHAIAIEANVMNVINVTNVGMIVMIVMNVRIFFYEP
jgi:hypothetical protein